MDASHIADQLLTASTALAGLLLVSVAAATSAYDAYPTEEAQKLVKGRYQKRGWLAFSGFTCALFSAICALVFYWHESVGLVDASAVLLLLALVIAFVAALISVLDIS